MKKDHVLSILITFTVGLIMGGYLYFTQFLPNFSFEAVSELVTEQTYTIAGEMYGGFRGRTAPAFQLEAGGTFRYVPAVPPDTIALVQSGTLPANIWADVERSLDQSVIETSAVDQERDSCASYVDGIDYRYTIRTNEAEYVLDTCTTAFTTTDEIGQAMASVWEYLETLE